ncbi:hypothetical protein P9112_009647 [Eukaryota sp. TZLM1-RC]
MIHVLAGSETGWVHSFVPNGPAPTKIQLDDIPSENPLLQGVSSMNFVQTADLNSSSTEQSFVTSCLNGCISITSPLLIQTEQIFVPTTSLLLTAHASSDHSTITSFSADGSLFTNEEFLSQIDILSSKTVALFPGLEPSPRACFSLDGSAIAIGTDRIAIHSVSESPSPLWRSKPAPADPLTLARSQLICTDINIYTNTVMASSTRGSVFIYDTTTASPPALVLSPQHRSSCRVSCVRKFDEHLVVAGDANGAVNVWDLRRPRTPLKILKGCAGAVKDVYKRDDWFVAVDLDQRLTIWKNLEDSRPMSVFMKDRVNKLLVSDYGGQNQVIQQEGEPSVKKIHNDF